MIIRLKDVTALGQEIICHLINSNLLYLRLNFCSDYKKQTIFNILITVMSFIAAGGWILLILGRARLDFSLSSLYAEIR